MTRTALRAVLATMLLASTAPALAAQAVTVTATNTATATVPKVVAISVDRATTALTNPTAADFTSANSATATVTEPTSSTELPTLSILANQGWNLSISVSWTTPAGHVKSASDLRWSTDGVTYAAAGTAASPAYIVGSSSTAPGATGQTTQKIYYATTWNLASDVPGNYSANVTYTLTAP